MSQSIIVGQLSVLLQRAYRLLDDIEIDEPCASLKSDDIANLYSHSMIAQGYAAILVDKLGHMEHLGVVASMLLSEIQDLSQKLGEFEDAASRIEGYSSEPLPL